MGVVHKLKENIINFILEQKKNNPTISCRQLSVSIASQFNMNVSKSSVNKILQEAELNSAVGRRVASSAVQNKKFQIPPEKKKELSQDLDKIREMDVSIKREFPVEEKPQPVFVSPDNFQRHVNYLRAQRRKAQGPAQEGMGFIFIKAAQWETSGALLPAEVIKKAGNGFLDSLGFGKNPEDLEAACEAFLFPNLHPFLGLGRDLKDGALLTKFGEEIKKEGQFASLAIEYNYKRQEAFEEIKGFKLCLEDGVEIVFDANLTSVWLGNVPAELSHSTHKSFSFLSKYLIGNSESVILKIAPAGLSEFSKEFYEMAAVFEDLEGKAIKKISVLNRNDQEWVSFDHVPRKKRTFMLGIWPWQREFTELTKSAKWVVKTPYYHEALDRIVYFAETKTDFVYKDCEQLGGLRAITIWEAKDADPQLMILTNQKNTLPEEITRAYMLRWPNWRETQENNIYSGGKGEPFSFKKENGNNPGEAKPGTLKGILKDYFECLHDYCQRHFFPHSWSNIDVSTAVSKLYGTVGFVQEMKDCSKIILVPSPGIIPADDLVFMAKKFNESYVVNKSGQRVLLEVAAA